MREDKRTLHEMIAICPSKLIQESILLESSSSSFRTPVTSTRDWWRGVTVMKYVAHFRGRIH